MRADRLISIMILLQNNAKITTKELASELEVSDRTILRDMDALSLSGIPVVADRGKTGGWRLMDHFQSQLSGLKLEDMKALFILPSEKMLEDLGVPISGLDIRQKLLASLPSATKAEGRYYLEKIYIDTDTWKSSKERNKTLLIVQQALWEDKKLNIMYQKANGDCSSRVVCPLGLVLKGSAWYLVALNENDKYRNFRLSRIVQTEFVHEGFTRPEHFNLSEYWKQSKLSFAESLPSLKVEILAEPSIISRMTFTDKFVEKVAADAQLNDRMVPVTLNFNTEQEAVAYVLSFGGAMKLVQPEYLIERVIQQAKSVIEMYDTDQPK
ncbi:helix-turn-helix transcriptional regulator [Paenibacillus abyssi]|uniref:Transcriptional regulator n=1 Tax=Paenibacillus abyssi TaxID=1340531 RepID=A0A917FUC8_9BACL|nr:YafY family protein [Paenibacillus abyssi]GGG02131.1 transcriptional regulator [Paenibacillus abyssi]